MTYREIAERCKAEGVSVNAVSVTCGHHREWIRNLAKRGEEVPDIMVSVLEDAISFEREVARRRRQIMVEAKKRYESISIQEFIRGVEKDCNRWSMINEAFFDNGLLFAVSIDLPDGTVWSYQ